MSLCLEWMKGNLLDEVEHIKYQKNYALRRGVIASGWGFSRAPTYLKPCVQHRLPPFFFIPEGWKGGRGGEGSCTQVNDGLLVIYAWGGFIICFQMV